MEVCIADYVDSWIKGEVIEVNEKGEYRVRYDEGGTTVFLEASKLRFPGKRLKQDWRINQKLSRGLRLNSNQVMMMSHRNQIRYSPLFPVPAGVLTFLTEVKHQRKAEV